MISYEEYKTGREKYLVEAMNVPDNEIDFIIDLVKIDITKALPQTFVTVYSADRTPFIRDNYKALATKSYKKIRDRFRELGWVIRISFEIKSQNITVEMSINKLKR